MDSDKNNKTFKFWQLLGKAEEIVSKSISSSTALEFLSVCNLSEKAEYSHQEAEQFLSVCHKVLNQGMSIAQIRQAQTVFASGNSAQKKSRGLAQGLAQSMALMEEQIYQHFPAITQQRMEELLAEPGLLEEIFKEARTRILKAEADGISLDEDYNAWLNEREEILSQIRFWLSKKRKRSFLAKASSFLNKRPSTKFTPG